MKDIGWLASDEAANVARGCAASCAKQGLISYREIETVAQSGLGRACVRLDAARGASSSWVWKCVSAEARKLQRERMRFAPEEEAENADESYRLYRETPFDALARKEEAARVAAFRASLGAKERLVLRMLYANMGVREIGATLHASHMAAQRVVRRLRRLHRDFFRMKALQKPRNCHN